MLNPWTQGTGLISKKTDSKGYPDVIYAVGKSIDELPKDTLKSMQDTADGVLARRVNFLAWRQSKWSFGVEDGTADIVLFADGAITRLGKSRLFQAMKNARTALKKKGRILFVANEEDERLLGGMVGTLDMGVGNKAVGKFGFDLFASRRDHGVVVGQMRKRGVQLVEDKAEKATEARGFVDKGSPSRPKALKGVRPVPRRR